MNNKYCPNCGNELHSNDKFCVYCRVKIDDFDDDVVGGVSNADSLDLGPVIDTDSPDNTPYIVTPSVQKQNISSISNIFKAIPKKALISIVLAIVAVAAVVIVVMNIKPTVRLDDYVEITYEGYEGYGRAAVVIDWDDIWEKYGSKISYTDKASGYGGLLNMKPTEFMSVYVSVSLDKYDGLNNGDEVTYTWNIDEDELSKYLKCKMKYEDKAVTVSGLKEIDTFDPFEDLSVSFSGVGPAGYATVKYTGDILGDHDFYCEHDSGLSNGDTVTVYLDADDMEYYAENYGKIPSVTEKEYTVEGLGKYASRLSEINDVAIASVKSKVESIIDQHTSGWSSDAAVDSVSYAGNYLETAKDSDAYIHNILGIVYKIDSHVQASDDYDKVKVTQYYNVKFEDVVINKDGSCEIDLDHYDTPNDSFTKKAYYGRYSYSYRNYYYYGYESIDDLVQSCNSDNEDHYDIEWNIDDTKEADANSNDESEGEKKGNSQKKNKDYILPDSDSKYLTKADLKGLSAYECHLARNELYARHGRRFDDEQLQAYFDSCDWYVGTIAPADFNDEKMLNKYEIANRDLIVEYEKNKEYTNKTDVTKIKMSALKSVSASSSLSERNMTHSANRICDGTLENAWVEGANGQGIGETVSFKFDKKYKVSSITINAGYQKSEDLYYKNSRPKKIKLIFSNGTNETIELQDVYGQQNISFSKSAVTNKIDLKIKSVYAGNKYQDTVISEVSFD